MVFSLAYFSLYGQVVHEPKIFIAPIEGFGREADNDYIYKRLTYEVILQYHTVVKSRYDCNYIFKGTVELASGVSEEGSVEQVVIQTDTNNPVPESPVPPISNGFGRREFFSMTNGDKLYFFDSSGTDNTALKPAAKETAETDAQGKKEGYYFKLEMIDSNSEEVISRQNFIFITTNASVDKLISTAVYNLFNDIPDVPSMRRDSRDRWLYLEASALWAPRMYYGGYDSIGYLGFGAKFEAEFHFIKFMSVGAGVQVTWEQIDDDTADFLLEAPLSLKYFLKLGENYTLEPYAGAAFNYSIMSKIQPSMFSWFAGVQFGIKDKKEIGILVFDARFAMDFANSAILDKSIEYQRYCLQVGVGYKFGFFQRRDKVK